MQKLLKNLFKIIAARNGKIKFFHFSTHQTWDPFYIASPKIT